MPITIAQVYCVNCHCATPKAYANCIHCGKPKAIAVPVTIITSRMKAR